MLKKLPTHFALLALLCCCLLPGIAMARGWGDDCSQLVATQNPQIQIRGSYNVPRDANVGYVIASFSWDPDGRTVLSCSDQDKIARWTLSSLPKGGDMGGGVYPTGLPGIGVMVKHFGPDGDVLPFSRNLGDGNFGSSFYLGKQQITYVLVVTGPVQAGTIAGSDLPSANLTIDAQYNIFNASATGMVKIQASTCSTPSVTVNMGQYTLKDFAGVGQPMIPAPKPFRITVNNCQAGINSVRYLLDPATSTIDGLPGVIKLDASSSASGVGLQVLDANGKPVSFDVYYPLQGFSSSNPGPYYIALKGTYFQTAKQIRGGTANTSLTFTMIYQ